MRLEWSIETRHGLELIAFGIMLTSGGRAALRTRRFMELGKSNEDGVIYQDGAYVAGVIFADRHQPPESC